MFAQTMKNQIVIQDFTMVLGQNGIIKLIAFVGNVQIQQAAAVITDKVKMRYGIGIISVLPIDISDENDIAFL